MTGKGSVGRTAVGNQRAACLPGQPSVGRGGFGDPPGTMEGEATVSERQRREAIPTWKIRNILCCVALQTKTPQVGLRQLEVEPATGQRQVPASALALDPATFLLE